MSEVSLVPPLPEQHDDLHGSDAALTEVVASIRSFHDAVESFGDPYDRLLRDGHADTWRASASFVAAHPADRRRA